MATVDNYKIKIDVEGDQNIDKLKNSIGGLQAAIATVGVIGFIHHLMALGDEISDLSDATGLAIGDIARFREGLEMSGGSADKASKMIAAFYQSIDKAANGSEEAQKALAKVGITFADVGNLSERDLLAKALHGLKEMGPGAERTAAGMDVLGKAFKNIDPGILEEAFASGNFDKAEEALRKLGDMADNMKHNTTQLEMAAVTAFGNIVNALEPFIGKVEDGRLSLEQAEKIVKAVGIALALTFSAKLIGSIVEIVTVVRELNLVMKSQAAIQAAMQAMSGPKGWAMLAAGAVAAGAAVYGLNKLLDESIEKTDTAKKAGIDKPETPGGPARKTQFYSDAEIQARKIALETARQQTQQLILQDQAAQKYLKTVISTVGMDTDRAELVKSMAQLEQESGNKILELNKAIEIEKSKGRGTNQGVINELVKQRQEVESNLLVTKKLKQEEYDKLQLYEKQRIAIQNAGQKMVEMLELSKADTSMRLQAGVIDGSLTQEQADRARGLADLKVDLDKKVAALETQRQLARTQNERDSIDQQIANAKELNDTVVRQTQQRYDQIDQMRQSSVAGEKAAFEQLVRAMDPYMIAQMKTNALWSSMSSAIDQFVETGKFSFSDFASSVIKDLLKIELKASTMKLWELMRGGGGGGGGGGGLLGGLISGVGSLLGFAEGGNPPVDRPSIVGEQGPELFIPKVAGTVVPTNQMGNLSGQKVQNTYITNNISAVDAQSVARLFANNRQSLLGSVEQARKELPMRGMVR